MVFFLILWLPHSPFHHLAVLVPLCFFTCYFISKHKPSYTVCEYNCSYLFTSKSFFNPQIKILAFLLYPFKPVLFKTHLTVARFVLRAANIFQVLYICSLLFFCTTKTIVSLLNQYLDCWIVLFFWPWQIWFSCTSVHPEYFGKDTFSNLLITFFPVLYSFPFLLSLPLIYQEFITCHNTVFCHSWIDFPSSTLVHFHCIEENMSDYAQIYLDTILQIHH